MTLEELIADSVARGEFVHLSIVSRGKAFSACFTPASQYGNSFAEAPDPVTAARNAITQCKMKRRTTTKPAKGDDMDFG